MFYKKKSGQMPISQNLLIIIAVLFLIGVVSIVIYTFMHGRLEFPK